MKEYIALTSFCRPDIGSVSQGARIRLTEAAAESLSTLVSEDKAVDAASAKQKKVRREDAPVDASTSEDR